MRTAIQFVFLVSIAAVGLCGVVALFSNTEPRMLGRLTQTAIGFAVASGIWMSAWRAWRGGRLKPVPLATLLAGALTLVAYLQEVWSEPYVDEKTLWAMLVVAVTGGLLSTLAIADLLPRFIWVRVIAYLAIAATAGYAVFFLVVKKAPDDTDVRLWGLSSILAATGIVVTPILHGVTLRALRPDAGGGPSLVRCPHCGHKLPPHPSDVF